MIERTQKKEKRVLKNFLSLFVAYFFVLCYNRKRAEKTTLIFVRSAMRQLLETTKAYTLLKERAELSHAYLVFFADAGSLEDMLPHFAKLFFKNADERVFSLIEKRNFSDCLFYPESGKKLSTENVESILEECLFKPVESDRKLFVLSDFSTASIPAQNKLLKILEEPPKGVYFLLGASVLSAVLPTVLSRVKTLEIPPFSLKETTEYLQRNHPNSSNIVEAASASGGFPKKAEDFLQDKSLSALSSLAFSLCLSPLSSLPALCKKAGDLPQKREFLFLLRMIFRDALVHQAGGGELLLPTDRQKTKETAEKYSARQLFLLQERLSLAEKDLHFNGVFAQSLELLFSNLK